MYATSVTTDSNSSISRPSFNRTIPKGAALAAGIVAGLCLFAGTVAAQVPPQPEGCSVGAWLSSSSLADYVTRLAVNGADIAACAEYLELQYVNNRFVLTREDYMALLEAAKQQAS